jgi:hypothetical protein
MLRETFVILISLFESNDSSVVSTGIFLASSTSQGFDHQSNSDIACRTVKFTQTNSYQSMDDLEPC